MPDRSTLDPSATSPATAVTSPGSSPVTSPGSSPVTSSAHRPPRKARPAPACPIRDGDPCSLCVPGVSGPQDCGLVYLVTSDPELREEWNARRRATAGRRRSA